MTLEMSGAVIPVDKPVGPTSHDVVAFARRALGTRRVGHTGTLDPFASGLLLLCVGPATRISEYLTGLDKEYEATARLGRTTTTDDLQGDVVAETDGWAALGDAQIRAALEGLRGTLDQVPPQFSAKKVDGEAMHRRARRGEHVELPPARVTVYEMEVQDVSLPNVRFRVRCSSGTYVRALARDLGAALGVGAHLTELRRTAIGALSVANAVPMATLENEDEVRRVRLSPLEALGHLPVWEVDDAVRARLAHGQRIPHPEGAEGALVRVATEGDLVAVGTTVDGVFRPAKVFA